MRILFLEYPKCSTCKKAKAWLTENGVAFDDRHIVEDNPTAEELKAWWEKSGLPLKKFFNTSGLVYKEQNLKERLPDMSEEEQLALLATKRDAGKTPTGDWGGFCTDWIQRGGMGTAEISFRLTWIF